jgi:hypothetical protein
VPHFPGTVDQLRQWGIEFVSQEQSFDTTTPMGKFTLIMFAAKAVQELIRVPDCVLTSAGRQGIEGKPLVFAATRRLWGLNAVFGPSLCTSRSLALETRAVDVAAGIATMMNHDAPLTYGSVLITSKMFE